ncbi:MAG TPA: PAS domain S-box protein [Thermoanaerobaculia bacterium]|jgi:PAS domain S-box-containing protein|nr:PAS domain S-box protein [Thermoanaerobaculia bacterium]
MDEETRDEAHIRRFAFLADLSHALSASLEEHETLSVLARWIVRELADFCFIDVFDEDGQIRRAVALHRDPDLGEVLEEMQRRYPARLRAPMGMGNVLRTGQSLLIPEVTPEAMRAAAQDERHYQLGLRLHPRSSILVPMMSRGRVLGAICMAISGNGRRYGPEDLALAEEIGSRAALALDNARLYHAIQEALRHRDQSVDALRGTNRTLHTLVQSCPLAVMVVDPDTTVRLWNPAAERIFGWREAEVLGKPLPVVPEDRREEAQRILKATLHGSMPQGLETVRLRKDGELIHVNLWTSTVPDEQGGDRILGLVADVTARKQIETALRKSDSRLRDLVDTAAEGVWILDADHRTTYVNRRMAEMLERPAHEILGHSGDFLFAPESRADVEEVWEACRGGLRDRREIGFLLPGGRRLWASASVSPVLDESGGFGGILAMLTDVTERRRLDDELRRRVEELAAEDRRKDEFLAMLAHELRNPLAAISNAGQVLDQGGAADNRTRDLVGVIGRQIRHLSRLVDDLLDVSRFTRGKIELRKRPVELRPIVEGAVETTRPLLERQGHRLTVSLPKEPVVLEADATRIEQVLANLLNNAAKFTEPGGCVDLSVEVHPGEAVLRVRDNGPGIAPDLLPRIFDLFVQEDRSLARSHGGLGIGLTLVRSLVERHGGRVEARSEGLGHGSEFAVHLPVLSGVAAISEQSDRHAPAAEHGPARVLLVEDNLDAADALAELLRMWGHEVEVVHDGASAVGRAGEERPDVVLLDIGLPGMDGYQVAGALRALPELHGALLVALTGYGQETDRRRTAAAGFDHHLVKPVDLEELKRLVATGRGIGRGDGMLRRGTKSHDQASFLQNKYEPVKTKESDDELVRR